jgi:SAM-dependent methyltransferase
LATLDVGCGGVPRGEVNVDTQRYSKLIRNFVAADCEHLPFKDNVFRVVTCFHVLEHLADPFRGLSELVRVSFWKIIIKCPHSIGEDRLSRGRNVHLSHFRPRWFWAAMRLLPCLRPDIRVSRWHGLPCDEFAVVRLPMEITCIAIKKRLK